MTNWTIDTKQNTRLQKYHFFFKNKNSTIGLLVKWEVCEKITFLSQSLAKRAVGV
jgi:hypothetical protein